MQPSITTADEREPPASARRRRSSSRWAPRIRTAAWLVALTAGCNYVAWLTPARSADRSLAPPPAQREVQAWDSPSAAPDQPAATPAGILVARAGTSATELSSPELPGVWRLPPVAEPAVEQLDMIPAPQESLPPPEPVVEALSAPNYQQIVSHGLDLVPLWENGLIFVSPARDFSLRVGGRLQVDSGFFGQSPWLTDTPIAAGGIGPNNDSTELRRARIRIEGVMWRVIGWAAEVDFATMANARNIPGNPPGFPSNVQGPPGQGPLVVTPTITDMFVTFTEMPVGNLRIGNFKEPLGLEHLTSSRWLDFMERSYNQDAFYGPFNYGFSPGLMLYDWADDRRSTWALWCGPNSTNPYGFHIGNQIAGTARVTYLPYYDEPSQGRYLVHLGTSGSIRRPDQSQDWIRARGDIRSGPPSTVNPIYADTGSFSASCQEMVNVEALAIWGPWTIQSEYLGTALENARQNPFNSSLPPAQLNLPPPGAAGNNVFFQGTYVEALYFLTGESRPYDRRAGLPTRIVPHQNFFWVRTPGGNAVGWGAFQVGARYSYLDLNSTGVNGGMLNSMTLGINWFWNANMKVQFNYDYTARGAVAATPAGTINSGGIRMAMDF